MCLGSFLGAWTFYVGAVNVTAFENDYSNKKGEGREIGIELLNESSACFNY